MSYQVLIVDDDPVVSALITALVARAGWTPTAAPDAHEALAHLAHEPCDLLISDVNMPVMTGLELRDRVRSDARLMHIPIVLLTANAGRATSANDDGVTLVLAKPVRPATFVSELQAWLAQLKRPS
jgi:CheY-like chemotaxis protein